FSPGTSSMELKWLPKMAAAAAPTGRLSPTRKPCCFTAQAAPASSTGSPTAESPLLFHTRAPPVRREGVPPKPMATQRDLSLAYSPGVAVPVLAIAEDPELAYEYTSKGNLVAVISNGTAILGLGNLGPLASKPVME